MAQVGGWRAHEGYHEVSRDARNQPQRRFAFVPGETNAVQAGELVCFKDAANLPQEMNEAEGRHPDQPGAEAVEVIWRDRQCASWCRYEPGTPPREQLTEQDQERERRADRRLTKAAIWFASIIGVAQLLVALLTMSRDSLAYSWLRALWCFFFCR
ncbi:MAG TPA: hypothetical protein VEC59_11295 [Steroidobacteraceae bacterium]|nr:hypothetical protein [Steroidobacteraceae bacterium]